MFIISLISQPKAARIYIDFLFWHILVQMQIASLADICDVSASTNRTTVAARKKHIEHTICVSTRAFLLVISRARNAEGYFRYSVSGCTRAGGRPADRVQHMFVCVLVFSGVRGEQDTNV